MNQFIPRYSDDELNAATQAAAERGFAYGVLFASMVAVTAAAVWLLLY